MTLVELLLAGTVSAITATAGATMIYAITSASAETRDDRTAKNQGRFALLRISKTIREARAIGDVGVFDGGKRMLLWLEDTNGDDVPNLYELGIIRYWPTLQEIRFRSLEPPGGVIPGIVVSDALFQDVDTVAPMFGETGNASVVVWAEGVESFDLSCFPNNPEARIVDVKFQIQAGPKLLTFSESITLRASGDYLFVPEAKEAPVVAGERVRRLHRSRWKGFYDLKGEVAPVVN